MEYSLLPASRSVSRASRFLLRNRTFCFSRAASESVQTSRSKDQRGNKNKTTAPGGDPRASPGGVLNSRTQVTELGVMWKVCEISRGASIAGRSGPNQTVLGEELRCRHCHVAIDIQRHKSPSYLFSRAPLPAPGHVLFDTGSVHARREIFEYRIRPVRAG